VTPRITAVSIVHELRPNPFRPVGTTAIDKRPVAGRVAVGDLGLAGDTQCDREVQGGP
jgi:MOSC domain-containing protein YiiM